MAFGEALVRFEHAYFEFGQTRQILDDVDFTVKEGIKLTLMGQNGAGKSTIFKLINNELKLSSGKVHVSKGSTVATARQVMLPEDKQLTVEQYFRKYYRGDAYNIDREIQQLLEVVQLHAPNDRLIGSFSGGQQARLLLAGALIQNPDVLLLDEPTNNLDDAGISHLTDFLVSYPKTVLVISHDAQFLNAFTDGVLYLDVYTHKIETYTGNYYDVVEQIQARIEKQNRQNALMEKEIQAKKDQANVFAHKGGNLRSVAKKMREKAEVLEDQKVDVRREDKTIRAFEIPAQEDIGGEIVKITSLTVIRRGEPKEVDIETIIRKKTRLRLVGPNGIGKTTLLESLAHNTAPGAQITPGVRVGYYRQDFSTLNFSHTAYESLREVSGPDMTEQELRSTAAGFLLTGEILKTQVGHLSEGQKGLLAFCRLVLQKPGLLILDEPTNHINFRHIPVIAEALDAYEGAMILVSHVDEFVWSIRIDDELDLGRL